MERWQQELKAAVTSAAELAARLPVDAQRIAAVCDRFAPRIPEHYLRLIETEDDPIWRQCIPSISELDVTAGLCHDPLAEAGFSPLPGLVHRHPDRALLLVSSTCALNCRFCFRRNRLAAGELDVSFGDLERAVAYLEGQPALREVILTGGEPLLLSDLLLNNLLSRLRRLPQLDLLRIHTRMPIALPARMTDRLVALLARHQPLYLVCHVNHPRELAPETDDALNRLAAAGIPLASQTVLLREVNDRATTLEELFRGLLRRRVRPYYLHQTDLAAGTGHFRTSLAAGLELVAELQRRLPGLALPQLVVDLPGGAGKVPLQPQRLLQHGGKRQILAADGTPVDYPEDPGTQHEKALPGCGRADGDSA